MSTEHQQYSTENQGEKIREYAAQRGIDIVRTYADEGKSGLNIGGRLALQQLIKDVEAGNVDFQIILVYDVIAATLNARVMQAQSSQEPFLDTFASMLQDELDRRRSRLTERRFKQSGLDERLSLTDFDWRFNPKVPRQACFELHTLKFITEGANALIIGKPGTGKSHVAKAVAYQATLQGYSVKYVEADSDFAKFGLATQAEQAKILSTYTEPDLLVLDDLFLARRIAEVSAELLQAIVHQRYKLRRSIVVTSNRVVQDWGKYLGDATMGSTILDRLMHRCSMLDFEGKSYRLREAAARIAAPAPSDS